METVGRIMRALAERANAPASPRVRASMVVVVMKLIKTTESREIKSNQKCRIKVLVKQLK